MRRGVIIAVVMSVIPKKAASRQFHSSVKPEHSQWSEHSQRISGTARRGPVIAVGAANQCVGFVVTDDLL